jgi:hypothetical protein
MKCGVEVGYIRERPKGFDIGRRYLASLNAEATSHIEAPPHFLGLGFRHGELHRPASNETRRLSCLFLQAAVEIQGVLCELCLGFSVAQSGEQTGGVPSGAAG